MVEPPFSSVGPPIGGSWAEVRAVLARLSVGLVLLDTEERVLFATEQALLALDLGTRRAEDDPDGTSAVVRDRLRSWSAGGGGPGGGASGHPEVSLLAEQPEGGSLWLVRSRTSEEAPERDESLGREPSGARVLLVEDNLVNRTVLLRMLEALGVTPEAVGDGVEAVERAAEGFSLVLMDLTLPRLGGVEATREIRSRESREDRPRTPVVALGAFTSTEDRRVCREAGMDGFLAKPVSLDELREVLVEHLVLVGRDDAPARPVLDVSRLTDLEDQLGDAGLVQDAVETFLSELDTHCRAISEALDSGNRDQLKLSAHSLKSSSAMLGAAALSEVCRQVERSSTEESLESLRSRWRTADPLLQRTREAFSAWKGA